MLIPRNYEPKEKDCKRHIPTSLSWWLNPNPQKKKKEAIISWRLLFKIIYFTFVCKDPLLLLLWEASNRTNQVGVHKLRLDYSITQNWAERSSHSCPVFHSRGLTYNKRWPSIKFKVIKLIRMGKVTKLLRKEMTTINKHYIWNMNQLSIPTDANWSR